MAFDDATTTSGLAPISKGDFSRWELAKSRGGANNDAARSLDSDLDCLTVTVYPDIMCASDH